MQARLRVATSWEVYVEGEFKHFSNGALDRPNKGANTVGLSAGVRYYPADIHTSLPVLYKSKRIYDKKLYCDISVGWAAKTLLDEWFLYYYIASATRCPVSNGALSDIFGPVGLCGSHVALSVEICFGNRA